MEVHIGGTEVRVNKLEELCQQLQCASQDIPNNIKNEVELQMRHLHQERQEADSLMADKRCLTAAIGNLQDLESLSHAQSWLTEKLSALDGPAPSSIYDKGGFQGTIFAEISSHEDCDLVVALLRTAGINQGDTRFGPHKTDHQWKELLAISALD